MSVKDNADVKPTTTKDEEVISLKENVHSKTVENAETPGLSDEEEDPHVSFKTWVVVWVSNDLDRWQYSRDPVI